MSRTIRVVWAAAVLAVVGSGSVAARQGGTVPREVIAVLFEGLERAPGGFDLRVGDAAIDFPRDLLPAGAEIAVSAVGDQTTTVVAIAPAVDAGARARYDERLATAGWINPQRPTGFVPSSASPLVSVCRGSEFATMAFSPRPAGGIYVRASLMTDPRRACAAQPSTAHAEVPLPSLAAPDGAVAGRVSMGGTSDTVSSSVRIRTDIDVEVVGLHYAAQLTAAGWRVEGRSGDPGAVSVTRLRATSVAGEPVTGLLIVTTIEGTGELDVMLRVVRHADGRR